MADYNLGPYRPRPRGVFSSVEMYRYLDIVEYNGSSYININYDTIDGIACIGVSPEGENESELYWMPIAKRGEKGDTADYYTPYLEVTNGAWDYSNGDKIFIPEVDQETLNLDISNVYDGCCGIIITKNELSLPANSYYSADYKYVSIVNSDDYYFYTFTYANMGSNSYMFIWHRTVINRGRN